MTEQTQKTRGSTTVEEYLTNQSRNAKKTSGQPTFPLGHFVDRTHRQAMNWQTHRRHATRKQLQLLLAANIVGFRLMRTVQPKGEHRAGEAHFVRVEGIVRLSCKKCG
jgi:hypothetical protein